MYVLKFILCILVVLAACIFVRHVDGWYLQRSEVGFISPGIGVMDKYESLC